jgi:hypothetical protein
MHKYAVKHTENLINPTGDCQHGENMTQKQKEKPNTTKIPTPKEVQEIAQDKPTPNNPSVLTLKQLQTGQQMLQNFIKSVNVKVKGKKVEITYHWELPNEQMALALAEGIKNQFGGD